MNTEQLRAEFEAWANGRCEPHLVNPAGRYSSAITQFAWEAYQAGRATLQSQEYTSAIGEAGQAYLDRFKNAHALPAEFRWSELWAVMCVAANKGRTEALQSQDAEDAERYRWLRNPCSGAERVIFYSRGDYGKGLMSGSMLDEAIDAARRAEGKRE